MGDEGRPQRPAGDRIGRGAAKPVRNRQDEEDADDHASFHGDVLDTAAAVALAAATVGAERTRSLTRRGGKEKGGRDGAAKEHRGREPLAADADDGVTTLERVLAVLEDDFGDLKK